MLLISRFTVPADRAAADAFVGRAGRALELLLAQPGCVRGLLVRSTESETRWVLTVEFDSVSAYRRSMSPFEVREHVIPLLAEADAEEPAAHEVVLDAVPGSVTRHESLLAADHATVRLGEAGGPATAR